ncbi:MAG: hypothetical protein ABI910_11380 [Gemmatimonadota bacterium]
MSSLVAVIVGTLAGLHIATWGMYKDAIHEGFFIPRYFRSVVVGAVVGVALQPYTGLDLHTGGGLVVFFGLVYVCERTIVEIWKTFFRDEDQSKYTIPMQFHLLKKPVRNPLLRMAVGTLCLVVVGLAALGINSLQGVALPIHPLVAALAVGSVGGWLTAIGGAWKDAPIEGFETLKFFRSPLMTMGFALLLAPFTDRWLFLAMGALGYERAAVETYKTFFLPNKPRGKFAGKPIVDPSMLTRRVKFAYLFGGIWLLVAVAYSTAWMQPSRGVMGTRGAVSPVGSAN